MVATSAAKEVPGQDGARYIFNAEKRRRHYLNILGGKGAGSVGRDDLEAGGRTFPA